MDRARIAASPRLRVIFLAIAAVMLFLWGWSLIPPIENWNNPYEDGFSYVGVFYATIVCLPAGLFLLMEAFPGAAGTSCAPAPRCSWAAARCLLWWRF